MNTLKLNSAGLNRVTLNTIGEVRLVSKPPIPTYTLSASVVNGVVSATLNGVAVPLPYTAKEGDVIVVSVTPTDGYTFEGWSDGNTDNPRTITMSEDVDLSAECVEDVPSYENGVYIQHIDEKLYTTEEWTANAFANADANGVAVVTDECQFVISKDYPSPAFYKWGGNGVLVEGITTTATSQEAILDFDGLNNTSKITSQLKDYTDTNGNVGAPCADACSAYTFPNGKKGYLPALGELVTLDGNKSEIDSIMSLIGGTAIKVNPHASSTQYNSEQYWGISRRDNSNLNGRSKASADAYYGPYVRPFTTL